MEVSVLKTTGYILCVLMNKILSHLRHHLLNIKYQTFAVTEMNIYEVHLAWLFYNRFFQTSGEFPFAHFLDKYQDHLMIMTTQLPFQSTLTGVERHIAVDLASAGTSFFALFLNLIGQCVCKNIRHRCSKLTKPPSRILARSRLAKTAYLMSDYICSVSMQFPKTEGVHMLTYKACLVTSLSYVIL